MEVEYVGTIFAAPGGANPLTFIVPVACRHAQRNDACNSVGLKACVGAACGA